ncbi:hypothetical protein KCU85_g68, partial [Aureobasidium melanogenum]
LHTLQRTQKLDMPLELLVGVSGVHREPTLDVCLPFRSLSSAKFMVLREQAGPLAMLDLNRPASFERRDRFSAPNHALRVMLVEDFGHFHLVPRVGLPHFKLPGNLLPDGSFVSQGLWPTIVRLEITERFRISCLLRLQVDVELGMPGQIAECICKISLEESGLDGENEPFSSCHLFVIRTLPRPSLISTSIEAVYSGLHLEIERADFPLRPYLQVLLVVSADVCECEIFTYSSVTLARKLLVGHQVEFAKMNSEVNVALVPMYLSQGLNDKILHTFGTTDSYHLAKETFDTQKSLLHVVDTAFHNKGRSVAIKFDKTVVLLANLIDAFEIALPEDLVCPRTNHCFKVRITRWPNVPLLVSEGGIVLQDVGREVDFGAFHLAEISINLLEAGSGASNIVRRSPEAELKSAIVGDVRVCGSSNSHDGLRGAYWVCCVSVAAAREQGRQCLFVVVNLSGGETQVRTNLAPATSALIERLQQWRQKAQEKHVQYKQNNNLMGINHRFHSRGCVSGVAFSSSRQIFMVLSASPVTEDYVQTTRLGNGRTERCPLDADANVNSCKIVHADSTIEYVQSTSRVGCKLRIPAFYFLVFGTREQVWIQSEFQRARGKVPDLDGPVTASSCEILISRFYSQCANPTQVTRNDTHKLPRSLPVRLGLTFLCGVGPFALGGSFPGPFARNARAFEVPVAVDDDCAETPSIIFAIFGLDACSSVLGFFRRLDRDAAALACLAASTGGSSFTSAYSLSIRDLKAIFCARSAGDAMGGAMAGRGELSSAVGAPKSAAKISRSNFPVETNFELRPHISSLHHRWGRMIWMSVSFSLHYFTATSTEYEWTLSNPALLNDSPLFLCTILSVNNRYTHNVKHLVVRSSSGSTTTASLAALSGASLGKLQELFDVCIHQSFEDKPVSWLQMRRRGQPCGSCESQDHPRGTPHVHKSQWHVSLRIVWRVGEERSHVDGWFGTTIQGVVESLKHSFELYTNRSVGVVPLTSTQFETYCRSIFDLVRDVYLSADCATDAEDAAVFAAAAAAAASASSFALRSKASCSCFLRKASASFCRFCSLSFKYTTIFLFLLLPLAFLLQCFSLSGLDSIAQDAIVLSSSLRKSLLVSTFLFCISFVLSLPPGTFLADVERTNLVNQCFRTTGTVTIWRVVALSGLCPCEEMPLKLLLSIGKSAGLTKVSSRNPASQTAFAPSVNTWPSPRSTPSVDLLPPFSLCFFWTSYLPLSALPPALPSPSVTHCYCLLSSLQSFRDVQVRKSPDIARPTLLAFGESTTCARPPEPVQASPVFSRPTRTTNTTLHSIPSSCLWHSPSFRSSSSSGISTLPDYIATYTNRGSLLLVPSSSLS